MSKNVRIKKSGAFRTGREIAKQAPVNPNPSGPALEREAAALKHRIERLQYVVSTADSLSMRSMSNGRRPHARQQLERRKAVALGLQFLFMALLIAAAIGWLNQRFHFIG